MLCSACKPSDINPLGATAKRGLGYLGQEHKFSLKEGRGGVFLLFMESLSNTFLYKKHVNTILPIIL